MSAWYVSEQLHESVNIQNFLPWTDGASRGQTAMEEEGASKMQVLFWLSLFGCCWTNNRLQRHNLRNGGPCSLCLQAPETIQHLIPGCVYSREIWFHLLRPGNLHRFTPRADMDLVEWWLPNRKRLPKETRHEFESLIILGSWCIWKE